MSIPKMANAMGHIDDDLVIGAVVCATKRRFRSIKIFRASKSPWAAKAK